MRLFFSLSASGKTILQGVGRVAFSLHVAPERKKGNTKEEKSSSESEFSFEISSCEGDKQIASAKIRTVRQSLV